MKKKALSLLLTLSMLLALILAFSVSTAAEYAPNVAYVDASGTAQAPVTATVVSNSDLTWGDDGNDGWYIVSGADVQISETVTVSGTVNLILADGCKLTVTAADASAKAGINVAAGNSLTIFGQEKGTGALKAIGKANSDNKYGGAGIGGNGNTTSAAGEACGQITINGGTITAAGSPYAAGIGGGYKGAGSNITINGGVVSVTGGSNAAGIGGGYKKAGSNITINGGIVTAKGSSTAVGIGSGKDGSTATNISVNTSLFIKSGATSASSETFHFSSADDTNFKARYLSICPELCEADSTKYGFLEDAIAQGSGKTITLLRDFTATTNYTLASNTTIALNGKVLSVNSGKRITSADDSITFDIAGEKDMETVNALNKNTSSVEGIKRIRIPEKQVWNITNNISTKTPINATRLQSLFINGNENTISGNADGDGGNYLMSFVNSLGFEENFDATINNIKFATNNKFEGCVYVASSKANTAKRANVIFNNVTFDNTTCKAPYDGVCIVSNWGSVTLKGECDFIIGENSYSAIDLTKTEGNTTLEFCNVGSDAAVVTFTDGRTAAEKAKEPLIGFDGESDTYSCSVTNADSVGLYESVRGTKSGYDLPVCKIGETNYGSVKAAVYYAAANDTIVLTQNIQEDVTVGSDKMITLDLNGRVLDLNGKHIVNKGTLTITDSNPTTPHTGTLADYAGGIITNGNSVDSDEALNGIGGAIVIVRDGSDAALTMSAGTIVNCSATNGGAIFVGEGASFAMNGGKIEKCSAERGGGISNYRGTVSVSGTVESCSAQNYGGGIFNDVGLDDNSGNAPAKVTLNNGADIKNCAVLNGAENDLLGGGVYNKGTLIMNTGAVIEGCSAEKGAGIHNDGNSWVTFTMNGGEIKDNTAKRTDGGKSTGGGVQVSANSTFTMLCGTITGNKTDATTQYGAGVYNKGTMTVGGTANISGNVKNDGTTASNLCLAVGKTVSVSTATTPVAKNESTPAEPYMLIGISTEATPTAGTPIPVTDANSTDYSGYFISDNSNYCIKKTESGTALVIKVGIPVAQIGEEKYLTVQDAVNSASADDTITLLLDVNENVNISKDVIIALNDHTLRGTQSTADADTPIRLLIKSETDMYNAIRVAPAWLRQTWEIGKDIELTQYVRLTDRRLIINGNNNTITCKSGAGEENKTLQMFSIDSVNSDFKNVVKINNLKIVGSDRFKNVIAVQNKDSVDNKGINLTLTNVEIDHTNNRDNGAAILNFGSEITVEGTFKLTTGENSCYAIGMDLAKKNAVLTFDDEALVTITDNRTAQQKADRALIFFSSRSSGNTASVSGNYVTENLGLVGDIGYNPIVTVSFDSKGGSAVAEKSAAQYWYIEKPADPSYIGCTFGGWYADEACESAWNFANDKVTTATTLYARWIQNSVEKAVVTGTVTDGSNPVNGAVVELRLGTEKVAAANTNVSGAYTFDNVENDCYNIVVTKDGKTKTALVNVNEASCFTVDTVVLPSKEVSSKVELKNTSAIADTAKANAANVVVGGVDTIAEAITPSGTEKITIALTVEPKSEDPSNTQQAAIKAAASGKTVEFLDFTLTKQINEDTPTDIGSTNSELLTINVPFDTTGVNVSSITVYRYHGTVAETFTKITNEADKADGKFMVNDGYITIYAKKFSAYAIGYFMKSSVSGSAMELSYTVSDNIATHGCVSIDKKNAAAGATVTLTVKADKGWTLETLTVKTAAGKEVTLTTVKVGETYTFTMPSSAVTVTATFMEDNTMLNFFIDVQAADYYYDAVLWAAANGITSGVDATHFAPAAITTRGQMVTFLWRAAGSPEPTATVCSFTDVKASEYYYKAVLWGVENGYVRGISENEFAPDMTVTRGQCVTFLARMNGVKDDDTGYKHSFTDVRASDYYNNAVAWAATDGITTGATSTTFAPNDSCLRGQIVTFIYRNFVK